MVVKEAHRANRRWRDVRKKLEKKLQELKNNLGHELSVVWSPDKDSLLSGEVHDNLIYVYERDLSKALNTLQHEFFDYLVSSAIQPYREVANLLIRKMNDDAHRRKEEIAEALTKFLDKTKKVADDYFDVCT